MRNARRSRSRQAQGAFVRAVCHLERRMLGFGMRAVAVFADRKMSRYHAEQAAASSDAAEA